MPKSSPNLNPPAPEAAHLPAPVFEDKKHLIKIFQGDCLDILAALPENTFDLIFADPPYFLSNNGITCHAGRMVSVNKGDWEPHKQLREIEESLRKCISETLVGLSKNWWKERIPPDAKQSAEERKAKDEAPWPWMEGKEHPVHYYLDFSDYSKIIKRRDNWRDAFQKIFKTEEWIDYWFKEIERIRIEIAHHRDLTERELTVLQLFSDDFSRVLTGAKSNLELPAVRDVEAPVLVEP